MIIFDNDTIVVVEDGKRSEYGIGTPEGFNIASQLWLRSGWDNKYVYSFTWLGRPVIQLPEDLIRLQEVIYSVCPDVLIETGVAHGGGLIFYASLLKLMGKGRVFGVDVELRPANRKAIEEHELAALITLIEGSSVDRGTVERVKALLEPAEKVMIILDSAHRYDHVYAELEYFAPLVSVGSYIVVCDGIMQDLVGAPRANPDWITNNPRRAALDFVERNPGFAIEEPSWRFNEGTVNRRVTYWPDAFIRRIA